MGRAWVGFGARSAHEKLWTSGRVATNWGMIGATGLQESHWVGFTCCVEKPPVSETGSSVLDKAHHHCS